MKLELTVDGEQKGVVLCVFIYIHVYAYICVCTYVHGTGSINPPTHTQPSNLSLKKTNRIKCSVMQLNRVQGFRLSWDPKGTRRPEVNL